MRALVEDQPDAAHEEQRFARAIGLAVVLPSAVCISHL
jgi:hypothetical protein